MSFDRSLGLFPQPIVHEVALDEQRTITVINDIKSANHEKICVTNRVDRKTIWLDQSHVKDIAKLSDEQFMSVSIYFIDVPRKKEKVQTFFFDDGKSFVTSLAEKREALEEKKIICEFQLWDSTNLKQSKCFQILSDQFSHLEDVESLCVFPDGKHVAGLFHYWESPEDKECKKIKKPRDDAPLRSGVFILDVRDSSVKILSEIKGIPHLKSLTVLSGNRLAVNTLLNGIYLYEMNFNNRARDWAVYLYHLKPDSRGLQTNKKWLTDVIALPEKETKEPDVKLYDVSLKINNNYF